MKILVTGGNSRFATKLKQQNHIFRLSCQEKYKHIKMFSLNPGPMRNDEEYEYHSKLMYDIVHNLEKYENGEMYSIGGGDKF